MLLGLMIGLKWIEDYERSVQWGVEISFIGIPCHGGYWDGMTKVHCSLKEEVEVVVRFIWGIWIERSIMRSMSILQMDSWLIIFFYCYIRLVRWWIVGCPDRLAAHIVHREIALVLTWCIRTQVTILFHLYCFQDEHEWIRHSDGRTWLESLQMSNCCSVTEEVPIARKLIEFLVHWNISLNSIEWLGRWSVECTWGDSSFIVRSTIG